MKKSFCLIAAVLLICGILSGCDNSQKPENDVSTPVASQASEESKSRYAVIDVDLTKLSSTMVYAEVSSMISAPENYIGKTVRMNGEFSIYHDDVSGNNYFAVLIADATACCQQGIEFVLGNNAVYPKDYPAEKSVITVQGVFETYMEGEYRYINLAHAELVS